MMSDKYKLDPYAGDIFPGEDIKLVQDSAKELDNDKRFSLTKSDPISILIALAQASSRFYPSKTYTIATVSDDDVNGSRYIDMIRNPQVCGAAAIDWAAVDFTEKTYPRSVLKIDPSTKEDDRSTFQRRARSESEVKQVLASFGMSDNDADEAWALTKERVSRN